MKKVAFKSSSECYKKEKSGIKNNIVIHWKRFDERFTLLDDFKNNLIDELNIEIINKETKESFIRNVRDVTIFIFDGKLLYIITWDDNKKNVSRFCCMVDKNLGVGETFRAQNKIFKVEIGYDCEQCFFRNKNCAKRLARHIIPECVGFDRKDKIGVIFVEVENESME